MRKIQTFCFPYAGGAKSVYLDWIEKYESLTEIIPMEYKGHGSLFSEPFYQNLDEAAKDLSNRIRERSPQDYILYGHSMGSIVAVLTAIQLQSTYNYLPKAVFISGMCPPHLYYKNEKILHLPKDQFMKKVFDLGQTVPEIMSEPELVDILYDILYNDTKLYEEYEYDPSLPKLKMPMVVMTGDADPEAIIEDMQEWQQYTESRFYVKEFCGDHFFPFNEVCFETYFVDMINKVIQSIL